MLPIPAIPMRTRSTVPSSSRAGRFSCRSAGGIRPELVEQLPEFVEQLPEFVEQLEDPEAGGVVKVTRIHHASVNAADGLDDTVRFYRDVLGLELAPRPEIPGVPGNWFTAGDGQVHVIGAPPLGVGIDPIGNHYCLAVDDLDAAIAELDAAGIAFLGAGQAGPDGVVTQVWVTDPAGNTVELQQG
jgi:catechol 2,3-dioxygenase-like lactoylglutathione lyase family enzyme